MGLGYLTVKKQGTFELVIQKSRFIGFVSRVDNEEEAQSLIQKIKKEHHHANHNCTAYMIGENDQIQKANDDGEPSGTAGVPMLEVLKNLALKNTLIVVTRYFGGIKLGAGGLIRAYSTTTSETIKQIGIVNRILMQGYEVTIPYTLLGKVEHALQNSPHVIHHIKYEADVTLSVYVNLNEIEDFNQEIVNLTSNQAIIETSDQKYMEKDVDLS